ncbi:hypothetical protein M8J75_012214 [Diaphorina citri]|nr:hypothetical protein M8J75_012214 [Diaphorina citri]KAI5743518.1 hypothetical protein M8J77_019105 [Diaphorina citri]
MSTTPNRQLNGTTYYEVSPEKKHDTSSPNKYRPFLLEPDEQDLFNQIKTLVSTPGNITSFEIHVSLMELITTTFLKLSHNYTIIENIKLEKEVLEKAIDEKNSIYLAIKSKVEEKKIRINNLLETATSNETLANNTIAKMKERINHLLEKEQELTMEIKRKTQEASDCLEKIKELEKKNRTSEEANKEMKQKISELSADSLKKQNIMTELEAKLNLLQTGKDEKTKNQSANKEAEKSKNTYENRNEDSDDTLFYITPEICIANDKKLQEELEEAMIINNNKKKQTEMKAEGKTTKTNKKQKRVQIEADDITPCDDSRNKISQLELIVKSNSSKIDTIIKNMEDNKAPRHSKPKTTKTADTYHLNKNEKPQCIMIGDSHLRYLQDELRKNLDLPSQFELKTILKPDSRIQEVIQTIPKNIKYNQTQHPNQAPFLSIPKHFDY